MKIIWVAGARPNFMKIAPIWHAMNSFNESRPEDAPKFEPLLVHTGQHYDKNMSDVFFRDLRLPKPNYHLGVSGGTHAEQVARILELFEKVLEKERPTMVGVVGDVNSTAACALATAKSYVLKGGTTPRLIHVEAGLRSRDRLMPEEVNRIVADALSDLFFTTEKIANENLRQEGVPSDRIFFVGNVMVDALYSILGSSKNYQTTDDKMLVSDFGLKMNSYAITTLHRPSNVDNPRRLSKIIGELEKVSINLPILFPVHPRTKAVLSTIVTVKETKSDFSTPQIHFMEPLGYRSFLSLLKGAKIIITDSGGLQGEATALGVPCLTLRNTTEMPVTIEEGTNHLLGDNPELIGHKVDSILSSFDNNARIPELWDGNTSERIVKVLAGYLDIQE